MLIAQQPTVGTILPLPHLGPDKTGMVSLSRWSESLGTILHVRENGQVGSTFLLYGDNLDLALAAWTTVPAIAA